MDNKNKHAFNLIKELVFNLHVNVNNAVDAFFIIFNCYLI